MIWPFQIAIFSCACFLLTSCSAPEKSEPIWQRVKIGDIAPSHQTKRPVSQLLKTINFDVYIFEIPAENISTLAEVWKILYTKPLQFNDYDAFCANSFSVGFGRGQMWNEISNLLSAAGARKVKTVSLLLLDGLTSDLAVAALYEEQTIFYISTEGSMEGATIGPGKLALRIKAQKIPGSRGVCNVAALPVFSSPIMSSIPQLAVREKAGNFLFDSVGFQLKMSPGDFVFLGPEKYISHQITLGSLFFSKPEGSLFFSKTERKLPERKPAVRIFLIVCTGIID